jgi:hypothetical protein
MDIKGKIRQKIHGLQFKNETRNTAKMRKEKKAKKSFLFFFFYAHSVRMRRQVDRCRTKYFCCRRGETNVNSADVNGS